MTEPTLGVILAGGLARRMGGGDKAMRQVGGQPVLARLIERLAPQVDGLIVNANGDPARFTAFALPVVPDSLPDYPGPLAGVLAGLDWAAENTPHIEWILTVPGDGPFLPPDLVSRLHAERQAQRMTLACAASGGWTHPVVALWPVSLRHALRRAVAEEGERKIDAFTARYGVAMAEWAVETVDPFFNVNTQQDLATADRLAAFESSRR